MRHLFSYLSRELGHPHPYTDALHRYSEQKQRRPATLSADFIQDLLEVTGNGRARDFEGAPSLRMAGFRLWRGGSGSASRGRRSHEGAVAFRIRT
jgi:hypothetical protein